MLEAHSLKKVRISSKRVTVHITFKVIIKFIFIKSLPSQCLMFPWWWFPNGKEVLFSHKHSSCACVHPFPSSKALLHHSAMGTPISEADSFSFAKWTEHRRLKRLIFFIYGLFNNSVSNSSCMALKRRKINDWVEKNIAGSDCDLFKVLSWYSPGQSKENHKETHSE